MKSYENSKSNNQTVSHRDSLVGTVVSRKIETAFPVFVVSGTGFYPEGTETYPAYYSFSRTELESSVNLTRRFNFQPTNNLEYFTAGFSEEFKAMCRSWALFRIKSVSISFVRDYTVYGPYRNLSTVSIGLSSTADPNLNTVRSLLYNYEADTNFYSQVVNTAKAITTKEYKLPFKSIRSSVTLNGGNDWISTSSYLDPASLDKVGLFLRIGQCLPNVTTSQFNVDNKRIAAIFVVFDMEFAQSVVTEV